MKRKFDKEQFKNKCYLAIIFILVVFWSIGSTVALTHSIKSKRSNVVQASAYTDESGYTEGNIYDYPAMNLLVGEWLLPYNTWYEREDLVGQPSGGVTVYTYSDNTFQVSVDSSHTQSVWIQLMEFTKGSSTIPWRNRENEPVYFTGSFGSNHWSQWRLSLEFYDSNNKNTFTMFSHNSSIGDSIFTMPDYDSWSKCRLYLYVGTYENVLTADNFISIFTFKPMLCSYNIPYQPAIETVYDEGYLLGKDRGFMESALPMLANSPLGIELFDGAGHKIMSYWCSISPSTCYIDGAVDFNWIKNSIKEYAIDFNYDISSWSSSRIFFDFNNDDIARATRSALSKLILSPSSSYLSNITFYNYYSDKLNKAGKWVDSTDGAYMQIEFPSDMTTETFGEMEFTVSGGAIGLDFCLFWGSDEYMNGYLDGSNSLNKPFIDSAYDNGKKDGIEIGKGLGYQDGFYAGVESKTDYSFMSLISAVVDVPVRTFTSLFNFNLLGVDLSAFFLSLLTLAIIVTFVKVLTGKGG